MGARRGPHSVQQREKNSDSHADLNWINNNRERGRKQQQELRPALTKHHSGLLESHNSHRDEEEYAGERSRRHIPQQARSKYRENGHTNCGRDADHFGLAAGFHHHSRARGACIHGKRACQTGNDIGDTDAQEIAIHITGPARSRGERSRRGR